MSRFFIILLFILSSTLRAQDNAQDSRYTEVGIALISFNYSGDLAQKRLVFNERQFGFGFQLRQQINNRITLIGSGAFGRISGDDVNNDSGLSGRKFKFFSPIKEFAVIAELHLLKKPLEIGLSGATFSPYIFGGAGITLVNPKAEFYGNGPNPFPEKDLKKQIYTTPVGFGLRADVYERISVSGSVGWRPAYSDYLDGVSLTGNPNNPDWYTLIQLGFSYVIRGYRTDGF